MTDITARPDLGEGPLPCPGCAKNSVRVIGGPGTAGGPKYWCGCDYCNWRTWGDTEAEARQAWDQRTRPHDAAGKLAEALGRLAHAEKSYRLAHDLHGPDDMRTGRAWDHLRRSGDHARAALAEWEAGRA